MIEYISNLLNIPSGVIIYFLALLSLTPLSYVFSRCLQRPNVPEEVRHLALLMSGSFLGYFVFGVDIRYLLFYSAFNFVCLDVISKSSPPLTQLLCSTLAFVDFGILLAFYIFFQTDSYDTNFLTPLAIMCLNVISLALDMKDSDGDVKQFPNRLEKMPPYVEFMAYLFSFYSFMVGPVVSFVDYKSFVKSNYGDLAKISQLDSGLVEKHYRRKFLANIATGAFALIASAVLPTIFPLSYMLTEDFSKKHGIFAQVGYIVVICFGTVQRYVTAWMLVCASGNVAQFVKFGQVNDLASTIETMPECILSNITPSSVYMCATMKDLVNSFNYKTNLWARYYIFKRFQFLGNKMLSSALTISFLCLWHGFHFGYLAVFATEFIIIFNDLKLEYLWDYVELNRTVLSSNRIAKFVHFTRTSTFCELVRIAIMKLQIAFGLAYFEVLTWTNVWKVIQGVYFIPIVYMFSLYITLTGAQKYLEFSVRESSKSTAARFVASKPKLN